MANSKLKVGKLNKRISVLQYRTRKDSDGNDELYLYEVCRVWASVTPLKGREYWEAKRINPETTYRVTMRYRPGIAPDMMIVYKDKLMEIESIVNIDEGDVALEITCLEHDKKVNE